MYQVRIAVRTTGDRKVEGQVYAAVQKTGGCVDARERQRLPEGGLEQIMTIKLEDLDLLQKIVLAVEAVRGAAVREVVVLDPLETSLRG